MHTAIQAIIFDADGTLIDSEVPGMDVLHQHARQAGLDLTREEAHQRFRGGRMSEIVAWIASQLSERPADFESEFTRRVRKGQAERFREELAPMPGAPKLLSRLPIPFCIATNGPREKIELTLKLSGLQSFFEGRVFSAYDEGFFKPDPRLFLHAATQLGVAPQQCAVVEDSLPGIRAGLTAGMHVFSLHPAEGLPGDVVKQVTFIDSLDDLHRHLGLDTPRADATPGLHEAPPTPPPKGR